MTDLIIDKGGIVSDVWDSRTTKAPHGSNGYTVLRENYFLVQFWVISNVTKFFLL